MTKFFTKCLGLLCLSLLCCFSLQNATADCAAGETAVTLEIATGSNGGEIGWDLVDQSSTVVASRDCGSYNSNDSSSDALCLNDGETYTFRAFDTFGDGWGSGSNATLTKDSDGCVIFSEDNPSGLDAPVPGNAPISCPNGFGPELEFEFDFIVDAPIGGCTDPAADNFNPCATVDDGSCFFNDLCENAESIECGDIKTGDTSLATSDTAPFCGTGDGTGGGVWYRFTGTGETVTASLCGTTFDTKLRVYTGSCGSLVCETGNDDNFSACGSSASQVTWTSVMGTDYYILVHGFGANEGLFELTLDCAGCTNPTANNFSPTANVDDGSCEACTDPTAHNFVAGIPNDDGSCETCDDGILNGDEIDVDCGGELCDDCPCEITSVAEIASYEGGCDNQAKARIVVVEFKGGIQPLDYEISSASGTFITQKGIGVYQVNGNGDWSIAASDASGCINEVEGSDFVYASNTASTPETNTTQNGTAMVEVSGGTPPYTVVWSNGVEGTIAASGGSHSITGLGRGKYEATVTDDEGGTALACVNVARVTSTGGRGGRGRGRKADISDVMNTLTVNPNPFANNTTVHFNLPESGMATMNVFALDGQQVATVFDAQVEAGENYTVELNASELSSGIYILQLTSEAGVVAHQRIVVTK